MDKGIIWPAQDCPLKLGLDEACLKVFSKVDYSVQLYTQLDECHVAACEDLPWKEIPGRGNVSLLVNSAYELFLIHSDRSHLKVCGESFVFSEHKTYTWNITENLCPHITPRSSLDLNYWLPLGCATIFIFLTCVLWMGAKKIYRSRWMSSFWLPTSQYGNIIENDLNIQPDTSNIEPRTHSVASPRRQGSRVFSLDTFRGICIVMMIFVNYGGGHYKIFKHTAWNGLTCADVIFPWFLWVMGVSMVLSLRSQFRNDRSRMAVWLVVTRRSVALILLGLILNSAGHTLNALHMYRIPGVLQRIGLAYFIIASVETCFMNPGDPEQSRIFEDIIYGWRQNFVALLLALTWLILTFLLEVPNCGRGYLGPGGLEKHRQYENCTGGAAGYIDRLVFTPNHIYQHPTCEKVFMTTQPHDPEGLLGTFTAAFVVHLGAQAGRIFFCYFLTRGRVIRWLIWGIISCICAGILCKFTLGNDGYIPINKNLFSLSYVLLTGGVAYLILAILYLMIDDYHLWDGAPFNYVGKNAILLYIGHEVVRGMFPWIWKPIWDTHAELLAMNLWGTFLWILIAYILWRKNIFVTVYT